jgi:hypothetical protein
MALVLTVGLAIVVSASSALGYDAATEFSINSNPNGVWSYGWSTNLGSAFQLYTDTTYTYSNNPTPGFDVWTFTSTNLYPSLWHNRTTNTITEPSSHVTLQAGQLAEHPGANGEYAIVRWTAPSAGGFSITSSFVGVDQDGVSTDVHVLRNNTAIFNGTVFGYGVSTAFATNIVLGIGDTIDFAVGYGSNHTYYNDLTGLSATIVPEPETLLVTVQGMICAALLILRRRKGIRILTHTPSKNNNR